LGRAVARDGPHSAFRIPHSTFPIEMTCWTLIHRSLRFHARAHFGVVLGAGIGSAALIGALIVGDSVKASLRERALSRLGDIRYALFAPDRLFRQALGVQSTSASAALLVSGTMARQDGSARANKVQVLGIDSGWPTLARWGFPEETLSEWKTGETVLVNETLGRQLHLVNGDEVILRIQKPTALSQDAVISPRAEGVVAIRTKVGAILPPEMLGDFSLAAGQVPPANVFLHLGGLQEKLGVQGRANLLVHRGFHSNPGSVLGLDRARDWLARQGSWAYQSDKLLNTDRNGARPLAQEKALRLLGDLVRREWELADVQLKVASINDWLTNTSGEGIRPNVELGSSRIFLEPEVIAAACSPSPVVELTNRFPPVSLSNAMVSPQLVTNGYGVLTYLANLIRAGDHATPYSMVTAAGAAYVPADMHDDEIMVNEWLADDLQVKPGDRVDLLYYVVDAGSRLAERTNTFSVRSIVPLKGIYADRTLMPEFPGLAKAESTQDWDAGFPLIYTIRDQDEAFWKKYRGTPKAFITLAAGQKMWANRFGSLTAIRWDVPTNSPEKVYRDEVYRNLLANLNPADFGLRFEPVREQALQAADQSQDFGQLFLGFSIFLVVSALLLMALLFQFGLEQRVTEVGTLLAVGLQPKEVRRLLLGEGAALAFCGGVLGCLGGLGYAKAMLWALTHVWRSATRISALSFHASAGTLAVGFLSSTAVATLSLWLALRKQARQPVASLLAGESKTPRSTTKNRSPWLAALCTTAAATILVWTLAKGGTGNAGAFFGAASLLLAGGLFCAAAWLAWLARRSRSVGLTLGGLGVRGSARRRGRSLAIIALLASGSFLIVAIGVFRLDANQDATQRTSGTGGFALIGESAVPVIQDLNTRSGREFFGLSEKNFPAVNVVQFRLHEGDDASCLNLNRAQKPRLLGVDPTSLAGRFTFSDVAKGCDVAQGWNLLSRSHSKNTPSVPSRETDEVPAIGDASSIEWALGKKVGDTMDYTDEHGRTFKLRLVGGVANSILQGSLIIDEAAFVNRFPSESGYRFFLFDAPPTAVRELSATLSRALQDVGLELTSAPQRLNTFNAVQNTYLGTFQILGGLGLLLGSAGLGVIVLRNVLERRGELALLVAVGFRRPTLHWLLLCEHGALLGLGLGLGVLAAAIAVLPSALSRAAELPYRSLALTFAAVLINGAIWTALATRYALKGQLLDALRNE